MWLKVSRMQKAKVGTKAMMDIHISITVLIQSIRRSRVTGGLKSTEFSRVTGHRDQRRNHQVRAKLEFFFINNQFFLPLSLSSNLRTSSLNHFELSMDRGLLRHFDENLRQSHLPRWCDETKISSCRSQVTGCDELIGLVQYIAWQCQQ